MPQLLSILVLMEHYRSFYDKDNTIASTIIFSSLRLGASFVKIARHLSLIYFPDALSLFIDDFWVSIVVNFTNTR